MSRVPQIPMLLNSETLDGHTREGVYLFTTEASDIQWAGQREIHVRSHRTGKTAVFHMERKDIDREGDVLAWHFLAAVHNCRLTIFND